MRKQTKEHIEKRAASLRGKPSPLKGRKLSEETKEKIRQAKLGKKRPDMIGENNPAKRKKIRQKITEAKLGHEVSEETRQKISEKLTGTSWGNHTDETKAKISKALTKKPEDCKWKFTLHEKAFDLFGKSKCQECGMTLEEHIDKYKQRLEMHNTLLPKNYKMMKPEAWMCLCKVCHSKIEYEIKGGQAGLGH